MKTHFDFLIFNLNKFDKQCKAKQTLRKILNKSGYAEILPDTEGLADVIFTYKLFNEKDYDKIPKGTIIVTINCDIKELKKKADLSLANQTQQDDETIKLYLKALYTLFEKIDEESNLSISYDSCNDEEFLSNILTELLEDEGVIPIEL